VDDKIDVTACGYSSPGGLSCQRTVSDDGYCVFHQGCNRKLDEKPLSNPQFQFAFDLLLAQKDGNWDGFVFPAEIKLPRTIDFPVNLRWARFAAFDQSNVTFENITDFSDAIFFGNTVFRNVTFKCRTDFNRCRFEASFELQHTHFEAAASFLHAEFSKRALFRADFVGSCNLNETTFRESVAFAGWSMSEEHLSETISPMPAELTIFQKINKQLKQTKEKVNSFFHQTVRKFSTQSKNVKLYRVFENKGELSNVMFLKPDQVSFSKTNLSKVSFGGTNLRGVRFLDVDWWQPKLGRNGPCDEIFIRLNKDGPFRYQNLPVLEQTCRNIRVSLEESRDFNVASDFYIAEMEALRAQLPFLRRHFFSVVALYRFVSNYGTSVATALRVLAYLLILHLVITLLIRLPEISAQLFLSLPEDALRSIKILSLQMIGFAEQSNLPAAQRWLDAVFRIFAPIQIAMLVLAFRARIKRH
jgi:uncharacterized protein YjbI with pentapeptide repeats